MALIVFVHMFLSFDMLLCVFCVYVLCVALSVGETDLLTSYANKNLESWILNLWSAPEQTVEQTTETPVIRDANALIMTLL